MKKQAPGTEVTAQDMASYSDKDIHVLVAQEGSCAAAAADICYKSPTLQAYGAAAVEAYLRRATQGWYGITVSDSDGCVVEGDSIRDAACDGWVVEGDSIRDACDYVEACMDLDSYGCTMFVVHELWTGRRLTRTVTNPPEELMCSQENHKWMSPIEVVGGIDSNPGVEGSDHGGVITREVCKWCGLLREENTGATSCTGERCTECTYTQLADGWHKDAYEAWREKEEDEAVAAG